ncbi:MAG: hypothetical protein ACO3AV_11595, partial [Ilumatobacteraceae bacterium]
MLLRGPGPTFAVVVDGVENIEVQARRDGFRSAWYRLIADPSTPDIRILTDHDVTLLLRLTGPATFCEADLISAPS